MTTEKIVTLCGQMVKRAISPLIPVMVNIRMNAPATALSPRQFNMRLGLVLFAIYLALYLGFVLINAFAAEMMETIVWGGLNLAIVYGFALIVVALVLALIYGFACRREAATVVTSGEEQGE